MDVVLFNAGMIRYLFDIEFDEWMVTSSNFIKLSVVMSSMRPTCVIDLPQI
jgi:hypothetical protein